MTCVVDRFIRVCGWCVNKAKHKNIPEDGLSGYHCDKTLQHQHQG